MYRSVENLSIFYDSPPGKMAQRALGKRIRELWPETRGMNVLGCGYAVPFLEIFQRESERVIAMMPKGQGVNHWPRDSKNLVFLSDEDRLPLGNNQFDRILAVHHLECCEDLQTSLREYWRALKPSGRLLVIVPNRTGFWARADWSPFGQGSPYSFAQLCFYLRDNQFTQERSAGALYTPPLRWKAVMRSSALIEHIGRRFLPFMAGVHIVEASKKIYAEIDKPGGTPVFVRSQGILGVPPLPVPQNFTPGQTQ